MVNSDDRKLPDGADIIAACQGGTGKVNFMDLTLFLGMRAYFFNVYQFNAPGPTAVSRQKIPTKTIQSWNFPKEHDDSSNSDEDGENSVAGPFSLYNLRSQSGKPPKDIDTISISSDSSMLLP
jgi:hypothetical protein